MPITRLKLSNVGPFDDIEFEFDRQVNVFTGPNNSGKSTVLWALGDVLFPFFEFPRKLLRKDTAAFEVGVVGDLDRKLTGQFPISIRDNSGYWNDKRRRQHTEMLELVGYTNFIPSLRRSTDFRSPGPTINASQVVAGRLNNEQQQGDGLTSSRAYLVSDEEVIQKIIELDYRSYRLDKPAFRDIIVKIGEVASEITEGFPIRFMGVEEDDRGLFPRFQTPDGDVPLNVLSQGTQSIIQWLAYFLIGYAEYYKFPVSLKDKPGILIVDEIDAHLHPSWQRRIIPTLTQHFPNLQIFCSTHSPLMLAGLKEGQAQLLHRSEKGEVTVSRNERDIIGWSADEILRNFLEVRDPTDLESVEHLERLQELRHKSELSAEETEELEKLRHTVNHDLLGGPMAQQLEQLTALLDQAKAELINQPAAESPISAPARGARRRRKPAK